MSGAATSPTRLTTRLTEIRKRFGRRGRWVLDGLDLTLPAGTLTVVAGGNGSGKSTLLRIAAGASEATSGEIRDRPRAVGYVPERLPARLRLTARQYVGHMGRIRGLPQASIDARADELFDRLALAPGDDRPIGTLSKGNTQKVALTQALLAPVGLLVLDEPFSGLDGDADDVLIQLLAETRAAGTAMLVSAHDPTGIPGADVVHALAGGRLAVSPGKPSGSAPYLPERTATVTLVPAGPTAPADLVAGLVAGLAADLTVDTAVHEVRRDGQRLIVRTDAADDLLRRALAGGWSVVEVRRGDGRPGAGR